MIVISISTDRKVFEAESAVRRRMIEYGMLFDELHLIVFAKKSLGLMRMQISPNVWLYPTNSISRFLYARDASAVGRQLLKAKGSSNNQTVVTTQDPFETGRVGLKLRNLFNAALQVQVHTDVFSEHFIASSLLNRIRTGIARTVLPEADEIRVVSERIKRSITTSLPNIDERNIDVLPIYVQQSEPAMSQQPFNIKEKYPAFKTIILMTSRLSPEKNIKSALDAIRKLVIRQPHAGLVIVGSGPEETSLRNTARAYKIEKNVAFELWQNNLGPYYAGADMFLSTSLFEGYGLSLVEAALAGLPVVTTDVGVVGELLVDGKNALVCPVNNPSCIAEKLEKLVTDPSERMRLGQEAKKSVLSAVIRDKHEYLQRYRALMEKALSTHLA